MTIEQVEELRIQEMNGTLRRPKLLIENRSINNVFRIQYAIYKVVNSKTFITKLINKTYLRNIGLEINGKGTVENCYTIKTPYGEGEVFNVKYLFKRNKCPLKQGNCFSNSWQMASVVADLTDNEVSDCVSGISLIAQKEGPSSILHSIVETDRWVIDVNWGICMSKELYYKLFMFEELARIKGQRIDEIREEISSDDYRKIAKEFNMKTYHLVFAVDDFIGFLADEERRNGHEEFEKLAYRY